MAERKFERSLVMDAAECMAFVEDVFPAVRGRYAIEELAPFHARVRAKVGPEDIRPGGTISGPAMFGLADCGFYIAVLAMIGKVELAVTTNATINFLNKPEPVDLVAEVRILKLASCWRPETRPSRRSDGTARSLTRR